MSATCPATNAEEHDTSLIAVVGIGADGFSGLGEQAQKVLLASEVVVGSWRQLNLLPEHISAKKRPWPSPMLPAIEPLFQQLAGRKVTVLGSGDPMFYGIGTTLCRVLGRDRLRIFPAASSASLACARLGWAVNTTPVASVVTNPISSIIPFVDAGVPFLILGRDETTPKEVCMLLSSLGHGQAQVHILSDLGGVDEQHVQGAAADQLPSISALNVMAVQPCGPLHTRLPGGDDDLFASDGQLTKQHIRALTVCALAPRPGELLWDIGGGSGSIAIEWLRSTPTTRAVCFESNPTRAARISDNATALGVPQLKVLGKAPESLIDAPTPDVVFIGGGLTTAGVFDTAWHALKPGGRLVANAVTVETEHTLWQLRNHFGGSISRFDISTEHTIGAFHALKPALPVTQWRVIKEGIHS